MPPEKHALLSASSASRWLKCTAAPRFEEHLPERTSEYAEEGRLAHAICELKTLKKFTVMTSRTYTTRLNKLKKDPLYSEEMDKTSDLYIEHLTEQAMLYDSTPTVAAEVQVDFGEYVPEGFGTCDNVMIGGDTLSITDYKHGKGVPVSAVGNPQMRLYALGALKRYLYKKYKQADARQKAVELGVQALLRDRIVQSYYHYEERGWITLHGLENVNAMYKEYHALGGNGTVTALVNTIHELEVRDDKRPASQA